MPNVARYHALKDFPQLVDFFDHKEFSVHFDPPNDIILADSGIDMPYLSYRVDPSNDAKNLVFKVLIHQQSGAEVEVSTITLSGGVSRTINELIKGSHLHKGKQKITFTLAGGIGHVHVSDVIMWFIRSG